MLAVFDVHLYKLLVHQSDELVFLSHNYRQLISVVLSGFTV